MSASAVLPGNAFTGAAAAPTDAELARVLGLAKPLWDALVAGLASEGLIDTQEWKCYSRKAGWSLRLALGKRTIVWLSPCEGQIRAGFVFGERALEAARAAHLPARIVAAFEGAPKYAEGTGIRVHIKSRKDLPAIRKLARVKLEN